MFVFRCTYQICPNRLIVLTIRALVQAGCSMQVELKVTAKIMPAGKGTPALRENVHSLGKIETEETDLE